MFPFNWGKVVSIFRYALICHKLVLSAQRSVLLYTLFLTFFLTLSHTLIFFVSPPMAEHIFIPRHWITIHNRIDTDIAHGIVCRGIYVGSTIYQRYTLHFGGKFKNIIFNLINSICADVTMITYFFFRFSSYLCCIYRIMWHKNIVRLRWLMSMQMIGYACALEALTLSLIAYCAHSKYRQVPDDETDLFPERGRELSPMSISKYDEYHHNHMEMSPTSPHSAHGYAANNHNNCNNLSSPECNQTPYIPGWCTCH